MAGLGINISGEYLDLYPETDIVFDFAPNNFAELETRQGITSTDFDLPKTSKNLRLLESGSVSCILESEGGSQFKGFLRVYKKIRFVKDKIVAFFTASNTEWISQIKGLSIRDLNLERFNHLYEAGVIVNSFNNSEGFIYPLIDYGNAEDKSAFQFSVEELAPATYVSTITRQIFQDLGVIVQGTLFDNPTFKKVVLPFTDQDVKYFNQDLNAEFDARFSGLANGTFQMGIFNVISGNVFVSNDGLRIENNNPFNTSINLVARNKTITLLPTQPIYDYDVFLLNSDGSSTFLLNQLFFYFSEVELTLDIPANGFISFETVITNFVSGGTPINVEIIITDLENAVEGTQIDVARSLPDISQEDFLSYIFFVFGVLAQYDVSSKTITLNQYKDLDKNKSIAVNVSGRLDLSKEAEQNFDEISESYSQINTLEYNSDSEDLLIDAFNEANGFALGYGTLTINNSQIPEQGSLYSAPFSGTFSQSCIKNSETGFANRQPYLPYLPRLDSYSGEAITAIEPRVLIVERGFDFGQSVFIDAEESETAPLAYFVKSKNGAEYNEITASLAFSNSGVIAPNDTPLISSELAIIQRMLSNGEGLSIYLDYELEEIQRIDFSVPFYIEFEDLTGYYFVSNIEAIDGRAHSYKFNLIKI
jgi:hypothetical protein